MREAWFLTLQLGENATTARDIVAPWIGQSHYNDRPINPDARQHESPLSERMLACLARPDDHRHAKQDARYYAPYIVRDQALPPI